jgi:hypothetical protein
MYDHTLLEMAETLSAKCNIRVDEAMNALIGYWQNKIAVVWDTDDVLEAAHRAGKPIIRTDAVELLKEVFDHHNPEQGLNWLTIEIALDDYQLNFAHLAREQYPEVHGVFKVWRRQSPIAHQFGVHQLKTDGNLPDALDYAAAMAKAHPGEAIFISCEPTLEKPVLPWLRMFMGEDQTEPAITKEDNHVPVD